MRSFDRLIIKNLCWPRGKMDILQHRHHTAPRTFSVQSLDTYPSLKYTPSLFPINNLPGETLQ